MHWFTALFVIALLSAAAVRIWLNLRQSTAVRSHRNRVPEAFAGQIDLASHQKAADYTLAHAKLSRWDLLLDVIVALALQVATRKPEGFILRASVAVCGVVVVFAVAFSQFRFHFLESHTADCLCRQTVLPSSSAIGSA